jgi:cell division protein FtsQ
LKYKSNIFAPSIGDVKRRLENVAWIKSAVVQRKLPDTISIRVAERVPIAILQSRYNLYLIDADGKVLEHDGIGNFNNLPIVIGEGAAREADGLLCCLNKFPKIRRQLVYAVRIGKRRWNIKINRGITVKLPEKGLVQALGILEEISDKNGYFNDDMAEIDMRIADRIIVSKKRVEKKAGSNARQ